MAMYVYHADGHTVGFLSGIYIYDLDGNPLGRIFGSRVHRLDGSYVGEWFKQTVVEKPVHARRAIAPTIPVPPRMPSPGPGSSRRGVVDYGYPDVFNRLYATGSSGTESRMLFDQAAE